MNYPKYMLTCYFCMNTFGEPPETSEHWKTCTTRRAALVRPSWGLKHVGLRPIRNIVGEVVFATQWKRLMEKPSPYGDDDQTTKFEQIVHLYDGEATQRHASLAASFITWLGTNCGGCFLNSAKQLAKATLNRTDSEMFLAQWAIENRRRTGVNGGGRMIEHFIYEGDRDTFGNMTRNFTIPTTLEYEVVDSVAYWLGTDEGWAFLDSCERLILARQKGLSDYDLAQLGLSTFA